MPVAGVAPRSSSIFFLSSYLTCVTDSYYWKSPDAQERKHESIKVLPREFAFGKVFPLAHGQRFEGDCEYVAQRRCE